MAPTIARDGPFRLFFFSREEERIHVHVAHADGETQFYTVSDSVPFRWTGLAQLSREKLVKAGWENATHYSWDNVARETLAVYAATAA